MVVGVCYIDLYDNSSYSLKDKRRGLKSIKQKLRNNFNICVLETDHQDLWQRSQLMVITGGMQPIVDRTLNGVIRYIKKSKRFRILNFEIERR